MGLESLDDLPEDDDFAKQLASNMEELMGGMDQDEEMKKTFEKIWKSFEENETSANPNASLPQQPSPGAQQSSFQDKIAQTMNKLKDSSKQVDVSDGRTKKGQVLTHWIGLDRGRGSAARRRLHGRDDEADGIPRRKWRV